MVPADTSGPYRAAGMTLNEANSAFQDADFADDLNIGDIERPAERAYQGIRRAILKGILPSGAHLREEALAQMTGTSRTPVREALRRVVAEGLARADNRHRYVSDFSFKEVSIVFDIRIRLESFAARVAAENITDSELAELDHILVEIDRIENVGQPAATERFAELNSRFHNTIIKATRSMQMQTLSAQAVSLPLEVIKQFVWEQTVNIAQSNDQHRVIVTALKQRNPDWAENAMAGHILSTKPHRPSIMPRG